MSGSAARLPCVSGAVVRRAIERALLAVALAIAAGCASPAPPRDDLSTLHAAMPAYPTSLSLIGKTDSSSDVVAKLITDSLVQYDRTLALVPRLAQSWEISPDGRTVTFHLRRGVRWQDGVPLTARDVLFTIRKVREPATEARSSAGEFDDLASLDAPDDLTVRARYSKAYADVLDSWTVPIIPEHVAGRDPDLLTGEFARHPVGCGPFRLARAEPGRELVLDANPSYWDGRPSLDRIVISVLPDERTAFQAILRGDLDLLGVTPDSFRQAAANPQASRLRRFFYYPMRAWYIGWNGSGSNPFFGDPAVRRAMVLALDRGPFIRSVLGGLALPAVGTYHPDSIWANRSLEPWPYDPAEAGRLLDAAGWRTGPDGVRVRGARRFSFTLTIPAGTQEITDRIAAWIQESLRKVGADVAIEKLEWATFLDHRRVGRFDAVMATLVLSPSPDQFELYHSSSRGRGMNYFGFADPEVDRLLEEGRRPAGDPQRHAVYDRLQARLHELEPISCLFHFAAPVLVDSRLEGVEPSPLGLWLVYPGPRRWRWTTGAGGA